MIPLLRVQKQALLLIAALLVLGGVSTCAIIRVMPERTPTTVAVLAETLYVEAKAKTDTVRVETVKWTTRWKVDTAYRADTVTLRDTLRVLVPLAQFDSTIRACSELASSCERERAAAERLHLALRDSIQRLQPSKWAPVKTALVFGAGIVIGGLVR